MTYKIFNSRNNTNSTGYDYTVLKKYSKSLSGSIYYLINLSSFEGKVPTQPKYLIVKPLYKKGNKTKMSNYRPVTLIPIMCKLFK